MEKESDKLETNEASGWVRFPVILPPDLATVFEASCERADRPMSEMARYIIREYFWDQLPYSAPAGHQVSKTVTINLPQPLGKLLEEEAARRDHNPAQMVRVILKEYFAREAERAELEELRRRRKMQSDPTPDFSAKALHLKRDADA